MSNNVADDESKESPQPYKQMATEETGKSRCLPLVGMAIAVSCVVFLVVSLMLSSSTKETVDEIEPKKPTESKILNALKAPVIVAENLYDATVNNIPATTESEPKNDKEAVSSTPNEENVAAAKDTKSKESFEKTVRTENIIEKEPLAQSDMSVSDNKLNPQKVEGASGKIDRMEEIVPKPEPMARLTQAYKLTDETPDDVPKAVEPDQSTAITNWAPAAPSANDGELKDEHPAEKDKPKHEIGEIYVASKPSSEDDEPLTLITTTDNSQDEYKINGQFYNDNDELVAKEDTKVKFDKKSTKYETFEGPPENHKDAPFQTQEEVHIDLVIDSTLTGTPMLNNEKKMPDQGENQDQKQTDNNVEVKNQNEIGQPDNKNQVIRLYDDYKCSDCGNSKESTNMEVTQPPESVPKEQVIVNGGNQPLSGIKKINGEGAESKDNIIQIINPENTKISINVTSEPKSIETKQVAVAQPTAIPMNVKMTYEPSFEVNPNIFVKTDSGPKLGVEATSTDTTFIDNDVMAPEIKTITVQQPPDSENQEKKSIESAKQPENLVESNPTPNFFEITIPLNEEGKEIGNDGAVQDGATPGILKSLLSKLFFPETKDQTQSGTPEPIRVQNSGQQPSDEGMSSGISSIIGHLFGNGVGQQQPIITQNDTLEPIRVQQNGQQLSDDGMTSGIPSIIGHLFGNGDGQQQPIITQNDTLEPTRVQQNGQQHSDEGMPNGINSILEHMFGNGDGHQQPINKNNDRDDFSVDSNNPVKFIADMMNPAVDYPGMVLVDNGKTNAQDGGKIQSGEQRPTGMDDIQVVYI